MMMVNRRIGEKIRITDAITVTVVEIYPGPGGNLIVRLGTEAPRYVPVDRQEVHDAKKSGRPVAYRGGRRK